MRHLRSSKSGSQMRRQKQTKIIVGPRARRIRRMLALA